MLQHHIIKTKIMEFIDISVDIKKIAAKEDVRLNYNVIGKVAVVVG